MSDPRPVLHLPARDIPIPTSVSAEAQAVMAMPPMEGAEPPALEDLDGWREMIRAHDEAIAAVMAERTANVPVEIEELDLDGLRVYDIRPAGVDDAEHVYLDIHGGAFIYGKGETCRAMSIGTATRNGARVWSVDYRMPPDDPFPAALDDCLAAYRALLGGHEAAQIIIGGASAGGNLAAALVLRARDEGLPLPAAVVLLTPLVDMTASGDSWQTNRGLDPLLSASETTASLLYAGDHDLTHPYLSPLRGNFTKPFPPTILTTGTRDMLLSDTVRMHRALRAGGIAAELHVTEAAGHGGFFGIAPEDDAITNEIRRFVDLHWHRAAGK